MTPFVCGRSPFMDSFNNSLKAWAAMLGAVVAFFALIQSRSWLAAITAVFVTASILALAYARRKRLLVKAATIRVDGRSLDSLNIANLRRRVSRSLVVQEARQVARVEDEDLTMTWEYSGYCRAKQASAIEFSIDSDAIIPFDQLECFAYDLRNDDQKQHKIRPLLIGSDGISKKLAVPFLESLAAREPFHVLLTCKLPGCMKSGIDYYTCTMSLAQRQVQRFAVRLHFVGVLPNWLRVYSCDAAGRTTLLKDLQPLQGANGTAEYVDSEENVSTRVARIYVFERAGLRHAAEAKVASK